MRSFRRATQRVAAAAVAVTSIFLLATCDLEKIAGTTKELDQDQIDALFTIEGDSVVILAGTTDFDISAPGSDAALISERWSSSAPAVASVDTLTGVVTGQSIGVANIIGRLLAPELDTGFTKQKAVRVRYKAIKVRAIDSIPGLGLTRTIVVNGTNANDVAQSADLTSTLTVHDSGSTASTVVSISGKVVTGKKPGKAWVVSLFENMRDSAIVKVRQVAKSITFPSTEYVAGSIGVSRLLSVTVKDVADSLIVSPTMSWRVADTNVAFINSTTGALRGKRNDTTSIFVTSDTVTRRWALRVQQVPAKILRTAGDSQTAVVATALPVAIQVTVRDSGDVPVSGAGVVFDGGTTGGTTANATASTDAQGVASAGTWTLGTKAGTQTLTVTSGAGTTTFTATATAGPAAGLAFEVQPRSNTTGANLTPAVKVHVTDTHGNLIANSTATVTIALGVNPGSATLSGTLSVAAVQGVATFSDLNLNNIGTGYTLVASSSGLSSATSNTFNVFGPAAKLGFVRQPSNVVVNRAIAPSVQVAVQDAQGNTVTTSTATITMSIGTNPGTAVLGGTKDVAAVDGVATFADLTLDQVANAYALRATSGTLTAATSSNFNVQAVGAPARVVFLTEPSNTVATQAINAAATPPGIRVAVVDSSGSTVTNSSQSVTLSILTNAGGGSLSGSVTQAAASGIATFTGVSINKVGTGYKLLAVADGTTLGNDTSATFNITVGAASKLGFVAQPSHINVNGTMSPSVQVAVQDAGGNTVSGTSHTVTVTASSGTLGGTTQAQVSNGIATFSNLTHGTVGTNYTLSATANPALGSPAVSQTFNVVAAGGATRLRFLTDPSNAVAGSNIAPAIQVEITDGNGNRVTTATNFITLSIGTNPGGSSIFGNTGQSAASGIATFSNINLNKAGSGYTLVASATNLNAGTSGTFNIAHGAATKVGFVGQPSNVVAGVAISPAVTVAVQDDHGNTVLNSTATLRIDLNNQNPCCTSLNGTTIAQAVNGIASFSNLRVPKAGTYTLGASFDGNFQGSSQSSSFTVSAAPAVKLGFDHIPNAVAGATLQSFGVQVQDSLGNTITGATNEITLSISAGPAGAVLNGTKTVTAVNGVATFSTLSINKSSDRDSPFHYQLSATTSGLAGATSSFFNINAGTPAKLVWVQGAPQNAVKNGPLQTNNGNLWVNFADQFDNLVGMSSPPNVTITLASGSGTLSGTTTKTPDNGGAAFFNDLTINSSGPGFSLTASATGMTPGTTAQFSIAAFGTADRAQWRVTPTGVVARTTMAPQLELHITDQYGNTVTTGAAASNTNGEAHLSQNPTGASLFGTRFKNASAGIATYNDLSIGDAGTYVLRVCGNNPIGGCWDTPSFTVADGIQVLTSSVNTPKAIAVNATTAFYGFATGVSSVPIAGGSPTPLATTTDPVTALVVSGSDIFFIEHGATGSVKKVLTSGTGLVTLASGLTAIGDYIAVDATNVYFTSQVGGVYRVQKVPRASGAVTTVYDIGFAGSQAPAFALNSAADSMFLNRTNGEIIRVKLSDLSNASSCCTDGGNTTSMFVSGNIVYMGRSNGVVDRMTTSGGFQCCATGSEGNIVNLVVDGGFVYWVENSGTSSKVRRVTNSDGQRATIQTGEASFGIAVDGTYVYWVESKASGRILRAPK